MSANERQDFERTLHLASQNLLQVLTKLDLQKLGVSEYNTRYISSKLQSSSSNLGLYIDLLSLCFNTEDITKLSNKTLIDYGGGSGLFSFLAKKIGVGTVIYNDIYDVSCRDVKLISDAINLPIDGMICGEIDDVITYSERTGLEVDAMCSFDVIEHIYDINGFLHDCSKIPYSADGLRLVFGSGANGRNPVINHRLRKKHLVSEKVDRDKIYGHKERDTLKSFLSLRQEIIRNNNRSLTESIVQELASRTRGLRREDIEVAVETYVKSSEMPDAPDDKTNTCDPLTGNWDEHIMDPYDLASVLEKEEFEVEILRGYWRGGNRLHTRVVKSILNKLIKYTGTTGFAFSPYYVIKADRITNATG